MQGNQVQPMCVPGGLKPLINQLFPPKKTKKKRQFWLCPAPIVFLSPVLSKRKCSTSKVLSRNTLMATLLVFSHSSHSGLLSHGVFCVCWTLMLQSCNPYRWITLPFSRVWQLEVGSTRCEGGPGESLCNVLPVPHRPQTRVYTWNHSD